MARLIKHTALGPVQVPPSDQPKFVCACGLSRTFPFCDGSHKLARQQENEGCTYRYEGDVAVEANDVDTRLTEPSE